MRFSLLLLILVGLLCQNCYYDKQNALNPESTDPCDTSLATTYNASIGPILKNNCVSCHAGSNPSGGIALQTYKQVADYSKNPTFLACIKHSGGAIAMPPGLKIRDCEISKIQTWITNGTPE
jgi:hypothetical protein